MASGPGQVVRVVPGLFPEAWRRGLMQPMRVWYLLRTLDQDANGRWSKAKALAHLRHLGWSQASAYRLISKGVGIFWREETTYPHGTRGQRGTCPRKTLVLVGAKPLAANWELERLPRHQVEAPLGAVRRGHGRVELPGLSCLAFWTALAPGVGMVR